MLMSSCLLLAILACGPATTTTGSPGQPPVATTDAPQVGQAPTNTPTPTESPYVEGSVVRAAYDPAAELGPPDVHDDFSGVNPEFQLDNASGIAHGWYQDGRFNITYPSRGWWTWYTGSTSVTNFYVDVVVYNGDQCADRDAAGLMYRYQEIWDFGMLFGVTCGGGYFSGYSEEPGTSGPVCIFLKNEPGTPGGFECSGLWTHPTSEYIDPGPGAANRIGVRAAGRQILVYINGHHINSYTLPSHVTISGNFGLYLGAGQADHASASFDDLSIWFNP